MSDFIAQQGRITERGVEAMITAAHEKASELGKPFTIVVVDAGGVLAGLRRMDGTSRLTVEVAQSKAYSAALANRPTHAWQAIFDAEPSLRIGIPPGVDGVMTVGGGYPVVVDGQMVGGIGVSGAHYNEDMEVARAGLAAIGAEV